MSGSLHLIGHENTTGTYDELHTSKVNKHINQD
jgi:hypothetical protein